MNLEERGDKYINYDKTKSPNYLSFNPYDKETPSKQYLLDQYDRLDLNSYFDIDYILELRENFFKTLKEITLNDLKYVSNIAGFLDFLDRNEDDIRNSYFLWVNLDYYEDNFLSVDVYSVFEDSIDDRVIFKLGDRVIYSFRKYDLEFDIWPDIKIISHRSLKDFRTWNNVSIDLGNIDRRNLLEDEYIKHAEEIRKSLLLDNKNLNKHIKKEHHYSYSQQTLYNQLWEE